MRRFFSFGILMLLCTTVQAAGSSEALLLQAMQLAPSGDARNLDSGIAIRAYIKAKLVHRKPDDQRDYIDSRRLLKPSTLFGHDLLIIEEEYAGQTYLGCCVSPGVGAVIKQTGTLTGLEEFAKANKCGLAALPNEPNGLKDYGVKMISGANYWQISCRERDLQAN
jgi:hypothetical protein